MIARQYRRIQLLTCLLAVLVLAAYLQFGLVPGKLKFMITEKLEKMYGQSIQFGRVIYIPFQGITIYDVKVEGTPHIPDFRAKRFIFDVQMLPLFRDRKIVISEAVIDQPVFETTMALENKTNVLGFLYPAILAMPDKDIDDLLPKNVSLRKMQLRRGTVIWKHPNSTGHMESIQRLSLSMDFTMKPLVSFEGNFRLGKDNYARLYIEGVWDLEKRNSNASLRGFVHRMPSWLKPFFASDGYWSLEDLKSPFEIQLRQNDPETIHYSLRTDKSKMTFKWKESLMKGVASVIFSGVYNFVDNKTILSKGSMKIHDGSFDGLPAQSRVFRNVRGRVLFDSDRIRFDEITAAGTGMKTTLRGSLDLTEPRFFDIHIQQQADNLILLQTLLPKSLTQWLRPEHFEGRISVNARLMGDMAHLSDLRKHIKIRFEDGRWKSPDLDIALSSIYGSHVITDEEILFENITFKYNDQIFKVNGALSMDLDKESVLTITHPKFTAHSKMAYTQKVLQIKSLDLEAGKLAANLQGSITDAPETPVALAGHITADLADLREHFGQDLPWLHFLQPEGGLKSTIRLEGFLSNTRTLKTFLRSDVPHLRLYDKLDLSEIAVDIEYANHLATLTYGKAHLFNGEVRFNGTMDFADKTKPAYNIKLSCVNAELDKARSSFEFLDDEFSGVLSTDVSIHGIWGNPRTMKGSGSFDIENGHLFKTDIYKKLHRVPFITIEGMELLTFNRAKGDFAIQNDAIHTENIVVSSSLIEVLVQGDIGFNQLLNLNFSSRFTPYVIRESRELGGFAPYVINQAEQKISEYAVTGSLSDPVYQKLDSDS